MEFCRFDDTTSRPNKHWLSRLLYQWERINLSTGLLAMEKDYTIEGSVTESAVLKLLKAGKETELLKHYTNWTVGQISR